MRSRLYHKHGSVEPVPVVGSVSDKGLNGLFVQGFETCMLVFLVISFFVVRLVPGLSESVVLQKYLQIYTAFFVGLECITRAFRFYTDYKMKDSSLTPRMDLVMRVGAFLVAFGLAIVGLLPINLGVNVEDFRMGPLVLATALGVFPFGVVEKFFNRRAVSMKDAVFTVLNVGLLLVGGLLHVVYDYNVLGGVLGGMLLLQGVSMVVDFLQVRYGKVYNDVRSKVVSLFVNFLAVGIVLVVVAMYFKQLDLAMPNELSFLAKKTN